MALTDTSVFEQAGLQVLAQQPDKGLYLAISCVADVSDPAARAASVWQRIKETTAFHWGMEATVECAMQPGIVGTSKPICHRTNVWFTY